MHYDHDFSHTLTAAAATHGFFDCAAAAAQPVEDAPHFMSYIARGAHGSMSYLERHVDARLDPQRIVPGARSVIVCLRAYAVDAWPVPPGHGRVAAYACGRDYHRSMARDLKLLARELGDARWRAFVDTGPVLERYWAARAGLACIGKHGGCLRRDAGSAFFIGVIITDADVPPTRTPYPDLCGDCTTCLGACPTGALTSPRVLDARKCLSYLSIEYRGPLPPAACRAMDDKVFGCDRCQDACPYNTTRTVADHPDSLPRAPFAAPALGDILSWSDATFQALTRDSAVRRATAPGLRRNALVVAHNLGLDPLVDRACAHHRNADLLPLRDALRGDGPSQAAPLP